jgi:type I restriction enzyme R subunit
MLAHNYTITNAIEDNNVLRFHIDYFQPDTADNPTKNKPIIKQAIHSSKINTILWLAKGFNCSL